MSCGCNIAVETTGGAASQVCNSEGVGRDLKENSVSKSSLYMSVYCFGRDYSAGGLGLMLGFMSGVLIYVSASHLLPEAIEEEKHHSMLAFLGGVALAVFIVLSRFA